MHTPSHTFIYKQFVVVKLGWSGEIFDGYEASQYPLTNPITTLTNTHKDSEYRQSNVLLHFVQYFKLHNSHSYTLRTPFHTQTRSV